MSQLRMCICFSVRNLQIWQFYLVFTVLNILLMEQDIRNIISYANKKKPTSAGFDEIWNLFSASLYHEISRKWKVKVELFD